MKKAGANIIQRAKSSIRLGLILETAQTNGELLKRPGTANAADELLQTILNQPTSVLEVDLIETRLPFNQFGKNLLLLRALS